MTPPNDDLRTLLRVGALRVLAAANAELGRIIDEANERQIAPDERVTVLTVQTIGSRWTASVPRVGDVGRESVIIRDGGAYHVFGWRESTQACSTPLGACQTAELALATLSTHAPTTARYGRLVLPDKETP